MRRLKESQGLKAGFLLLAVALSGCGGGKNEFVPAPPPEVTVQVPEQRDVTTYMEFPGRTSPFRTVEIRARVKGFLESRPFEEGMPVKKGDTLFTIEPESFIAAVAAANGDLLSAEAAHKLAIADRKMKEKAGETNAVSKLEVERARAQETSADAAVKVANAALEQAKIDESYTKIIAPEAGRTSRAMVDIGNLVGSGDSTLLTTVINDTIMYAYFEVNERVVLPYLGKLSKASSEGGADKKAKTQEPISLRLGDGNVFGKTGVIDFVDNEVDANTGTIRLRAKFDNKEAKLVSGLFVRVMIPEEKKAAILVPRQAIQRDMGGDFVLVVNGKNVVERRNVTTADVVGETKIVEKGLKATERVIVQGLQRAREGVAVNPKEAGAEEGKAAAGKSEPKPDEVEKKAEPDKSPAAKKDEK